VSRGHVIVDGYNLLHAHPAYASAVDSDIDGARARLVADLAGFAQGGPRTIVVFDGGANPDSDGSPHHVGGLTVIFSPHQTSADQVIEGLARRFRQRGEPTLVVTSDTATRQTVVGGTVSILSSARFAAELAAEGAGRLEAARAPRTVPLSRRIAPDVSDNLARWARGGGPEGREGD